VTRAPSTTDVDHPDGWSHPSSRRSFHAPEQDERRHQHGSRAIQENVRAIGTWERAALHSRSRAERIGEWITAKAASGPVLAAHVLWFLVWILANTGVLPGITPFDPFPFPFLTMTVSLEAIFLALFVLASQNRLAHHADKRAHLDLQVDLLAEREMTTVLQILRDIARGLGVEIADRKHEVRDLASETDIHELTHKVDEIELDAGGAGQPALK
jgi:uncharacterized membrane protein